MQKSTMAFQMTPSVILVDNLRSIFFLDSVISDNVAGLFANATVSNETSSDKVKEAALVRTLCNLIQSNQSTLTNIPSSVVSTFSKGVSSNY